MSADEMGATTRIARAVFVPIAALVTLGCAVGGPSADSSHQAPSSLSAAAPATSAPVPTVAPAATALRTPRPTSTPLPVPPKPTGVRFEEEIEAICDPDVPGELCGVGDSTFRLSWTKPRTTGVEIRVYGVKACYGADAGGHMIDGWCLREHTALPASARVLVAKAPAPDGHVTFQMAQDERWFATLDGVPVFAFVLAAYNADGAHSIFAIALRAEYCVIADVACNGVDEIETFSPGSWMTTITPDVRVRSRPALSADSAKYTPLLPLGTEFEIVRGPVPADGYRWYEVQLTPGILDGGVTRGWVADGSRDGEPWIERAGIDEG